MSPELEKLVEQWKQAQTYRDMGSAAKKAWKEIEKIATIAEQVEILKSALPGCT